MDDCLKARMFTNSLNYKSSLERIIDKYSKLQYQDGGIEVDLDSTNAQTLEDYMRLSRATLNKLEAKSLTDLREESMRAQDVTRDSQFDLTYQDGGGDETSRFSLENDVMPTNDTTCSDLSSLNESQRNISETEFQPEDQDEDLNTSLRSYGSSLLELYPSMISRLGRAWHRQHVSEAADSVLRRYRRWRQQPSRSGLGNTFIVTLRNTSRNPETTMSQTLLEESSNSPVKRRIKGPGSSPRSPLQIVTNMQQQSPGGAKREQPVLVMDFAGPSEISLPKESSLNDTFIVSEVSWQGERPSTFSPSRSCYPGAKPALDRSRRLSLTGCFTHASETTVVKERPDIYGSPVRQSPLQARMMAGLARSPQAFPRSPRAHFVESFSREPTRLRLMSDSPQKPAVSSRMLYPQDSHHSLHPQLRSPRSATAAEGHHRLRRHLSFDSAMPSIQVSYSPKELDEDFLKLYHKFVCQSKSSFFSGLPCRLCARSSEASRGPSSSSLAALALSPHRSLLRKRHREMDWASHPQSKRCRDERCSSSPGSKRHGKEMLRRYLSPSESERSHDGLSYSSTKPSMFQRFSTQQRSADTQETRMSRHRCVSAVDFTAMGSSLESRMAIGSSPRKW